LAISSIKNIVIAKIKNVYNINFNACSNMLKAAQGIGADILFMAWQVRCNKKIGVRARCRLYVMFVVNLNAFSGMCPNTSIAYA
jgi:hypothetical protein